MKPVAHDERAGRGQLMGGFVNLCNQVMVISWQTGSQVHLSSNMKTD